MSKIRNDVVARTSPVEPGAFNESISRSRTTEPSCVSDGILSTLLEDRGTPCMQVNHRNVVLIAKLKYNR
jgi:hypothetical protein